MSAALESGKRSRAGKQDRGTLHTLLPQPGCRVTFTVCAARLQACANEASNIDANVTGMMPSSEESANGPSRSPTPAAKRLAGLRLRGPGAHTCVWQPYEAGTVVREVGMVDVGQLPRLSQHTHETSQSEIQSKPMALEYRSVIDTLTWLLPENADLGKKVKMVKQAGSTRTARQQCSSSILGEATVTDQVVTQKLT